MVDPKDPLPSGERIAGEERARLFAEMRIVPSANPEFSLRLLVPRTWQPLELPGSDRPVDAGRLTPLCGWQDPAAPTSPAIFHVQATALPRELTAEHFLVGYAAGQQLEILATRAISDTLADGLVAQEIRGAPCLVRMATCFDGDRAYLAMGVAHRNDYDAYADVFGAMIASIAMDRPLGRPNVEERVTHTLLDSVACRAPASFQAREVPDGTETHAAVDLFVEDLSGVVSGQVRVDLDLGVREPSLRDELVYTASHVMAHGVTLGDEMHELSANGGGGPLQVSAVQWVEGKDAGGGEVEVWMALLKANRAALRVWMLSPARESSFLDWAVNQRAFRVVLDTLEVAA